MATMVTSGPDTDAGPRPKGTLVVAAAGLLAVLGSAVVMWTVLFGRPATLAVGEPVRTAFGTVMVTRVSTTFVPDTQGPPTQAQHVGANGSDQLQVWVRLANTRGDETVVLTPGQFRLRSEHGAAKTQDATGSTLTREVLSPGGSIEGQLWFDGQAGTSGRRWLLYTAPGGETVRIPLGAVSLARTTSDGPPSQGPNQTPNQAPNQGHGDDHQH